MHQFPRDKYLVYSKVKCLLLPPNNFIELTLNSTVLIWGIFNYKTCST